MTDTVTRNAATAPRWDGQRILFTLEHDGREVPCAISSGALWDLTSRRCFKPNDVLASFASARTRVEAIAQRKLRRHTASQAMTLTIWSTDIEDDTAERGQAGGR
ncbi:MAG TPA: DUF1488 family protein [Acetobacteraceae bacterium]|jgi:hypothetical protein|nr:DUF1488 family protein [Acetobacteraceae bacterium]